MDVSGKVAIVTGGGNGIGRAIARKLNEAGSKVVIADLNGENASAVAAEVNGLAVTCDVAIESDIQMVVEKAEAEFGPVDLFVSNAGITTKGGPEVPDEQWQHLWQVNLMAHVYAARAVLPGMVERGSGYLVQVASAAGLLTEIGSAPYSVTKHAAVSFAEWVAVHYRRLGIHVSCVCPAGVATDFLNLDDPVHEFLHFSSVTPEQVADDIMTGIDNETFLITPHDEAREFFEFKGKDYERWIHNFSRLHQKIERLAERNSSK